MNSSTNPVMKTGSELSWEAIKTTTAPSAMARKFQKVTTEPLNRSASAPPTGRMSDPSSGPRKVSAAALTGTGNWSGNCTSSTCPNAKPKPMNEPKVPM